MFAMRLLSEGGEIPNTSLQGVLFGLLGFFLLMVIVGWLTSNRNQDQAEVTHEASNLSEKEAGEKMLSELKGGRKSK